MISACGFVIRTTPGVRLRIRSKVHLVADADEHGLKGDLDALEALGPDLVGLLPLRVLEGVELGAAAGERLLKSIEFFLWQRVDARHQ